MMTERSNRVKAAAIGVALLLAAGPACAEPAPLRSIYAESPTLPEPAAAPKSCPQDSLPPVVDLAAKTAYAAGDYTRLSPAAAADLERAVKGVREYLGRLSDTADRAMLGKGAVRDDARRCALGMLTRWAEGRALLGDVAEPQGGYERKWSLVTLALAYQKLYAGGPLEPPPAVISSWFKDLAAATTARYPMGSAPRNNHYYWAAAAAMASATVTDDHALYEWGLERLHDGLAAIDQDGFLPLELKRGQYALHYHAFSAWPLVLCAAFEAANGRPLPPTEKAALDRLVHRVLDGLSDPRTFEQKSGQPQHLDVKLSGRYLPWLEVYDRLQASPEAEAWIAAFRPMAHVWMGGDATRAFGRELPPSAPPPSPFPR